MTATVVTTSAALSKKKNLRNQCQPGNQQEQPHFGDLRVKAKICNPPSGASPMVLHDPLNFPCFFFPNFKHLTLTLSLTLDFGEAFAFPLSLPFVIYQTWLAQHRTAIFLTSTLWFLLVWWVAFLFWFVGVDLSHFDACEQPGINLGQSSQESFSSADSKETFNFFWILSACLPRKSAYSCRLRDFIRKSLQPVSFSSGLISSSCKLIHSLILLFIFFLFNHCFSMALSFRALL